MEDVLVLLGLMGVVVSVGRYLSKMIFNEFKRLAMRALCSHIGFLTTPETYEQIKKWAPGKEFTELMTHA